MSDKVEVTSKYINGLKPLDIATDRNIGEHVVNKFMAMYQAPREQAVAYWEREKDNFTKRVSDSDELKACSPMSLFFCLMRGFGWKLSFEPGQQPDLYLLPSNRNIAPKGAAPQWVKEAVIEPSPYGKKKIRIQNGQIKDTGKPIIVYDCDSYKEFTDDNDKVRVKWEKGIRTENSKIIGSFIRIEKPDGSHEFATFGLEDVASWKNASAKKNGKKENGVFIIGQPNALYTSNGGQIDKLFFEGKTLTHAFKGYPVVVNVPRLPDTVVFDTKEGIRQGLDVSEFTEDADYSEVQQTEAHIPDEFTNAINEAEPVEETITITAEGDPEF